MWDTHMFIYVRNYEFTCKIIMLWQTTNHSVYYQEQYLTTVFVEQHNASGYMVNLSI